MAYLDRTDPRGRATAIVTVAAVHAVLGLALITGLSVAVSPQKFKRFIGITLPPPPPPPTLPEPQPTQATRPVEKPAVAPTPQIPIPKNVDVEVDTFKRDDAAFDGDKVVIEIPPPKPPLPSPTATLAPKGVSPLGNSARWITTDDYPSRALRDQAEGLARYRLIVASDGKVSACEITASSGNTELDRATCRLLLARARFAPATDQSGAKVVGTYSGTVRWDIPD